MYKTVKHLILILLKYSGVFAFCRHIYRGRPRILCYHGFHIVDENLFIPGTFISTDTFKKRLELLKSLNVSYVELDDVLEPQKDKLPVVLTFDDGFVSTLTEGLPILKEHQVHATLYVTTYYHLKENPIFRLHLQYLLWKLTEVEISWDKVSVKIPWQGREKLSRNARLWEVIKYFEEQKTENERAQFMDEFSAQAGLSLAPQQVRCSFTIANNAQLTMAQNGPFDIQLHTHRHRFPLNKEECLAEITENRTILEKFNKKPLVHFCYPSGHYDKMQFPWLEEVGVKTATTLRPGLVHKNCHPLELPRILDSENLSLLEFEAKVSGLNELLETLLKRNYQDRDSGNQASDL